VFLTEGAGLRSSKGCVGLRAADTYANCIKAATPLPLQDFVVDLRECLRAVWRKLDGADPRTRAQRLATYHAWMALPLKPSTVASPFAEKKKEKNYASIPICCLGTYSWN